VDNFRVGPPNRIMNRAILWDDFTVGVGGRVDGLFNDNNTGGYSLESDRMRTWTPFSGFAFATGEGSTCCGYPGNAGNPGASSGLAQSGAQTFSVDYGLTENFMVEVSAVIQNGQFSITSGAAPAPSLSVLFRKDGVGAISLTDGITETSTGLLTGITDTGWHRYALDFNRGSESLGVFVDGELLGRLDLGTFANGRYATFSNDSIGLGGTGGLYWVDNFRVGLPEPGPGSTLAIRRDGLALELKWLRGVLQEAEALTGPWTNVPNASSPLQVTPVSGTSRYYRLSEE